MDQRNASHELIIKSLKEGIIPDMEIDEPNISNFQMQILWYLSLFVIIENDQSLNSRLKEEIAQKLSKSITDMYTKSQDYHNTYSALSSQEFSMAIDFLVSETQDPKITQLVNFIFSKPTPSGYVQYLENNNHSFGFPPYLLNLPFSLPANVELI